MVSKKNIYKFYFFFLFTHLFLWTLIPSLTNVNLPLDTIEALAWGSNLSWGFNKHPPFSAFAVESFYKIFGNQDWAYYLLSQLFVISAFIAVFKHLITNEELFLHGIPIFTGLTKFTFWQYIILPSHFLISS